MHQLLNLVRNSLAPLTLGAALAAYLHPPAFLIFAEWFLWFFAATMFALGTVTDPSEFGEVLKRPRPVLLGLATQYTVMPFLGFAAGWLSGLEPALALGFVIVGCAPGAMASNVIVYLAGGAVAFSVTLTTLSTLVSPLLTPSLAELLGGFFLPVPFWPMVRTILTTVLLPLLAGLLLQHVLGKRARPAFREAAPATAVVAIVIIIGYAVAANHARLAEVGPIVFGLVVILNLLGYVAGWYLGRIYRFTVPYRLALTVEIGMQNAGLGVALALEHFDSKAALPGALFATWCILTAAAATRILRGRREALAVDGPGAAIKQKS